MRMLASLVGAAALVVAMPAAAISTFTYQGTLESNGQPASGPHDFQFELINSNGLVIATIARGDVIVTGGVFTVVLDYDPTLFGSLSRSLRIGVRPGASVGAYTTLAPDTPILASPHAIISERAISATTANSANDVVDGAIDTSDIAIGAVTETRIGNGAVTNDKITNNTLTLAKAAGANGHYSFALNIGANDCNDYDIAFGGDVLADDIPILSLRSDQTLAPNLVITAIRVPSNNVVTVRGCNVGTTSQSTGLLVWRLVTLR